ncbi:MAG: twin-arginine translocase TatA/TatE family subunit [Acidimicrobiales bacterium]
MLSANLFGPDLGIVAIVIVAVLLFGSQAPKIARNLGMAGKEFRKAQAEAEQEHQREQVGKGAPSVSTTAAPLPSGDADKVTLSRSELDALLAAREAEVKRQSGAAGV